MSYCCFYYKSKANTNEMDHSNLLLDVMLCLIVSIVGLFTLYWCIVSCNTYFVVLFKSTSTIRRANEERVNDMEMTVMLRDGTVRRPSSTHPRETEEENGDLMAVMSSDGAKGLDNMVIFNRRGSIQETMLPGDDDRKTMMEY